MSRLLPGVVGGAVVAVGATVGAALTQRGQHLVEETVRQRTEFTSRLLVDHRGKPPRVADVDDLIELGVHPAAPKAGSRAGADQGVSVVQVPPFVRRDRSDDLEEALRAHRFVLVVGESTAGKSRAAFEAVKAVLPEAVLVGNHPLTRDTRARLDHPDAEIWLYDAPSCSPRVCGRGDIATTSGTGARGSGGGCRALTREVHSRADAQEAYGVMTTRPMAGPARCRYADRTLPCIPGRRA
ncbi:hypothetical protein [Streptomyces mangrovisoli]|uniref:hypothetical protein n=1 Tax=Streptomyces mangrovisoli TaxID=1428628 RepID=UPI00142E6C0A|nr:hypothetical protein [Streptomyces mangrovisoli]